MHVLGITFPIYATIAIGFVIVRIGWFDKRDMKVLGDFVLQIALPALLFITLASRDVSETIRPDYMLIYLLGGLATIVTAFAWFSVTAPDAGRRAVAVMGSTCPNNGFIGYPIVLMAFPEVAGIVLGMNFLIENIVLIPICLMLMDASRSTRRVSVCRHVSGILWAVLKRPMIIGLLLGLAVSVAGIPLPSAVTRLCHMLAGAAAALSLIVIGGSLVGLPLGGNRKLATQIAAMKLLVHPMLTALTMAILVALGYVAPDPALGAAVVLSSAMPMLGIYAVLAQERGLEGLASIAMMITTSAGFLTVTGILWWVS